MRRRGPSLPPSRAVFVHAVEEEQGACSPPEQTLTLQALRGGQWRRDGSGICRGQGWTPSADLSTSLHWKILGGSASRNAAVQLQILTHHVEFQLGLAIKNINF